MIRDLLAEHRPGRSLTLLHDDPVLRPFRAVCGGQTPGDNRKQFDGCLRSDERLAIWALSAASVGSTRSRQQRRRYSASAEVIAESGSRTRKMLPARRATGRNARATEASSEPRRERGQRRFPAR